MKKYFILSLAVFAIISSASAQRTQIEPPKPKLDMSVSEDFNKEWKQIDSLDQAGLPKSALEIVNTIYASAKAQNKTDQFVKAVIYKLKYSSQTEEDAIVLSLTDLKKEALQAPFPARNILHSMLAEMYWNYYQQNRYRFLNRTATVNFVADDIHTWDLTQIVEQVKEHYLLSLRDRDKLITTSVKVYNAILYNGRTGSDLRPTLYDFLGQRAVSFFSQTEAGLTKPADQFLLADERYFSEAARFVAFPVATTDSLSFEFQAIVLFQDLLKFRLADNNIPALMDLDLQRLGFVHQNSVHPLKDKLYLSALDALEKKYAGSPVMTDVTFLIASFYFGQGSLYAPLKGDDHKWELKKAFDLCETAIGKFPDSDGAQNCKNLQSQIQSKSLALTLEKITIPNEDFRGLVTFKNVNKLYFRVVKTDHAEYEKIHKKDDYPYSEAYKEKIVQFYASKKATHEFSVTFPTDGDYQTHSAEVKIPGVGFGDYVVLAGTDQGLAFTKNAVVYDFITASSISYINRNVFKGGVELYVLDRKTGAPLNGVSAQLYSQEYNYKTSKYSLKKYVSATSDKEGYIKVPYSKNREEFSIEFTKGGDRLITVNEFEAYGGGNVFRNYDYYDREDTLSVTKTFYFTDRAIYRPGQTIYFKGIMLQTDGKKKNRLSTASPVSVSLYDVNGQSVSTLQLTTNEFGTFSGTFTAPSAGLNGEMRIEDGYGSAYFSVEDYKRPKFAVEIAPLKGSFRLKDKITVKGKAASYSGANIDDAEVKYRVVRNANFPSWWFYWRGYYPASPAVEIANGVTRSDAQGEFDVTFEAIPDLSVSPESRPSYTYVISADVTDQNGETRSTERSITVGYSALKISTAVGEMLETNHDPEFAIQTTNLDGEFEAAKGSITIFKLKTPSRIFRSRTWQRPDVFTLSREEYYKSFPNDLYADENNPFTWEKDSKVFDESFDTGTKKTFSIAALKNWKPGKYMLEVSAKDKYNEETKEVIYFTVIDRHSKELPYKTYDFFNVLKGTAEPGEKALLLTGSSAKTSVLYEIEQDNVILSKQWISVDNQQLLTEIPISESYRGNIGVHYTYIVNNRLYTESTDISVPYTNKMLDVSFETFRNKLLPGEKESWKVRISGKQGEKAAAEMVATLYDASLDVFRPNYFTFDINHFSYASLGWHSERGFENSEGVLLSSEWNPSVPGHYKYYDALNWFDYSVYYFGRHQRSMGATAVYKSKKSSSNDEREMAKESLAAPSASADALSEVVVTGDVAGKPGKDGVKEPVAPPEEPVKARTNFNETAFFYPQLQTDANGDVLISFTIPEALTKWKMLGFAHTKDLKYGFAGNELVTQKDLMITTSAPRFLREGDKILFTAKVNNISENDLAGGVAKLELFDAVTMKPVDALFSNTSATQSFSVKKGQSTGLVWNIAVPEGVEAVTYRVTAKAGSFSDGEEMALPVLTNSMLVTESLPLSVKSHQTKTFTLDKLAKTTSTTRRNHKLTLEFTANPAWYAVQALPYLMEYPYECAEQTFSRFYANSLASHIANANPKVKRVFDNWKNTNSDALVSNLAKNQELKALLLEETPWVVDAQNESENKKRIGLLFDLNKMANEQERALVKLQKMQHGNGGWPWFEGMRESWYITQHILAGLGHLDHLKVKAVRESDRTNAMIKSGLEFIDNELLNSYTTLKRLEKEKKIKLSDEHISYMEIHYLYARSFFTDIPVAKNIAEAFEYFKGQATTYWTGRNKYMQGMIALALYRWNEKTAPAAIIKSLREFAITSEEMGMYWKNDAGFHWYQAPVETQALLIEVFGEVAKDQNAVDEMKIWLLKQKQTQNWATTKATAEACYALLLQGGDWLASDEQPSITVGGKAIDFTSPEIKTEAGTGYFKTSWSGTDITPAMGTVTVSKKDVGVSWGSLYWQYFEKLDKITPHETPLKLKKQLFLQKPGATGPVLTPIDDKTELHPGDLVKVRIELRVDRDMEYVHMKDMRASSFEPVNVLSQYKYQDGLGYYESTRDAATNFFFDYLPKGTYVFEYPLRVTHAGDFSNGVTTIQSMYAPEFTSHSEGVRVKVN